MFASVKTIGERDGEDGGTNPYFFYTKSKQWARPE
jgi:hypothetical protein